MVAGRLRKPAAVLLLLSLAACAKNPVTDKTQFMVVSEEKEIRVGDQAAQEIKKEYGYYDELPGLNAYLNEVGEKLVAHTERQSLVYHFQVLNTPMINAFALPGGYVYVTRGLLARLNSEDELASVLGHELTHVAARHTAAMLSKAYAVNTAVILASILYPGVMGLAGDLANIALGLAFLGYSRNLEEQADDYGLTYLERAGYNPQGALRTFQMFQTLEDEEPGKMERFLLSHPPTKDRLAYAQKRLAAAETRDPASLQRPLLRDEFLARIEGLMLGQADGEKVVVASTFYQKHHGAVFTFPDAYAARLNPPDGEVYLFRDVKEGEDSEKKPKTFRAVIGFEVRPLHKPGQTTEAFIEEYLKSIKQSTHVKGTETLTNAEGLPLTVVTLDMSSARGPVRCMAGFYLQGKTGFILYGYTLQSHYEALKPEFARVIDSLRFPPAEEVAAAQPPRLKIVTVAEGETWEALAGRELGHGGLYQKLAAFNGYFDTSVQPAPGTRVKIPSVQALVSKES